MFGVPIYDENNVLVGFATIKSDGGILFEIPATQASRNLVQLLTERHWNSFRLCLARKH